MPIVPKGIVDQRQIDSGVGRASQALAADVVRIRYSLGTDWSGDPSVFFRIVLTDDASKRDALHEVAQRVALTLRNEVKAEDLGLNPYFNFRSYSEQAELKEPAWV